MEVRRPDDLPKFSLLSRARDSHARAVGHLCQIQHPDGSWEGEMVLNTMPTAQYVIVMRIVGQEITENAKLQIIKYLLKTRLPGGAWGLHKKSGPYVYFTALSYIALRLLGMPATDPPLMRAREWLNAQPGGALSIPGWGRIWLSLIGLVDYRWAGPYPPEAFLVPRALPLNPERFSCQTREIYRGLAYLYGIKFQADLGQIADEIRSEIIEPTIDPMKVAPAQSDVYAPQTAVAKMLNSLMRAYNQRPIGRLRKKALTMCLDEIIADRQRTSFQGLGLVPSLLYCLVLHSQAHPLLKSSLKALEYYRWDDDLQGRRYAGSRSQSWDTAFALDCLTTNSTADEAGLAAIRRGYKWLRDAQNLVPAEPGWPRDRIDGGWSFTEGTHQWPVSDCTAEAISALIQAHRFTPESEQITADNLNRAYLFMESRQNSDGGFSAFEARRAPLITELLNSSEMFADVMVDRSYTECTGSVLRAHAIHPRHLPLRAVKYLKRQQLADGSFEGSWGINYIYGTFFAVRGLTAAGFGLSDTTISRAVLWIESKQKEDGGWGEHVSSPGQRRYVESPTSEPLATSWALMTLISAGGSQRPSVQRGIQWLCERQTETGTWRQDSDNSVVYRTGVLNYALYEKYFPAMALARYIRDEK